MKRLTGIVVAGLLSCGYAGAQGPMRGEMHGMAPQGIDRETIITRVLNSPETAAKVGLSKEQVEKLKSVQFEFQKKEVALKAGSAADEPSGFAPGRGHTFSLAPGSR